MYPRNRGVSIFSRVGFEVLDARGRVHRHYYRDYHLLTTIWETIPFEQLAALERLRQELVADGVKAA